MTLPDAEDRRRALTELETNLVVEAAAGTGKTSLLAGRVAMLLAGGYEPGSIAAITFTELAASDLAHRVREMAVCLARGGMDIPHVLRPVVPEGLNLQQAASLRLAVQRLDELTVTTIHGFCQGIIKAYSVEAGVDPGARVLDEVQADALFDAAFAAWLATRLGEDASEDRPVAVFAREEPRTVVGTLRELAKLRRQHPSARPPAPQPLGLVCHEFLDASRQFGDWYAQAPQEDGTGQLVEEVADLASFFEAQPPERTDFAGFWTLAHPPRKRLMLANSLAWREYPVSPRDCDAVAEKGAGRALYEAGLQRYNSARGAFARLLGCVADHLMSQLSDDLDGLLVAYAARKRAAAALDFDDLLLLARDLVRTHPAVCKQLGERFRHICVDEFQDTDPVQAEIIFSVATAVSGPQWQEAELGPGSLFLVGDPKQSIYRFRGADVDAYEAAKAAICSGDPSRVLTITTNFRSRGGILEHVNGCFEPVLRRAHGQPEYVRLAAAIGGGEGEAPCAAKLTVSLPPGARADEQREAEAERVAQVCARLVGAVDVRREDGTVSPLRPGDIALLAPTHTELWRYERALEAVKLSVASQAGKALMRRQETQDVLALARTLADPLDTVAFGALMRGPLVGLSENQLLDIEAGLRPTGGWDGRSAFNLRTDPSRVSERVAREVLIELQQLRRHSYSLTPRALLSRAVERLRVRVALTLRTRDRNARALANLDAVLEMARPYSVRGLQEFARDLGEKWSARAPVREGRTDADDGAIELVTFHSSKGLEWPVVIPVNAATGFYPPGQFLHRRSDNTVHWALAGVYPPGLELARSEQQTSEGRERARVWYVACTRARDLLILPWLQAAKQESWFGVLDLGHDRLPELDISALRPRSPTERSPPREGPQSAASFATEAAAVAQASRALDWHRPSERDPDRTPAPASGEEPWLRIAPLASARGSRARGILLHKVMEELLTGRLPSEDGAVRSRAAVLARAIASAGEGPDPLESAQTALATLALGDIAALRPRLVAEVPIYARDPTGRLVAARADAMAVTDGKIEAVLDWKSDVEPSAEDREAYAAQVCSYMQATGAAKGAVVYMTAGRVEWV